MFKEKDRVKHTATGYTGIVKQVFASGEIIVDYDDPNVLPCKLPASQYEPEKKGYIGNPWFGLVGGGIKIDGQPVNSDLISLDLDTCPKCGGQWTETFINYEPKYDCVKCNIRKEDCD